MATTDLQLIYNYLFQPNYICRMANCANKKRNGHCKFIFKRFVQGQCLDYKTVQYRKCAKCGDFKPCESFPTNGKTRSGGIRFHSWCKSCLGARNLNWQKNNRQYFKDWADKNEVRVKQVAKNWRINHSEIRKKNKERYRSKDKNHKKELDYAIQYRLVHLQEIAEYMRLYMPRYYASPRGKAIILNIKHKRRTQIVLTKSDDVKQKIIEIKSSPIVKCYICGCSLPGIKCHIDHIIPLSKGGTHTGSNIAPACPSCNRAKGDKIPTDTLLESLGKKYHIKADLQSYLTEAR